jgi:glucose-6-phosphate 1-epimerase
MAPSTNTTWVDQPNIGPALKVDHPNCTGLISLYGGQVLQWAPTGHRPVLYVSPSALYQPGKAIRGGIPVCWPWFGPLEGKPEQPSHGLARTAPWQLDHCIDTTQGVEITLSLDFTSPANLEATALPSHLRLIITMGSTLELRLITQSHSASDASISTALHSYFAVSEITQCEIRGVANTTYLDELDLQTYQQTNELIIGEEIDRIYHTQASISIVDSTWDREITVSPINSNSTVVWNPWIDKSKRIADLPDTAYRDFVCIETARLLADKLTIPAGQPATFGTKIEVR